MLEYVQVQDSTFSMVSQMNPEGNKIWFGHFSAFSSTIPTGTSSVDALIPNKYSVLKTLITSIRDDAHAIRYAYRSGKPQGSRLERRR